MAEIKAVIFDFFEVIHTDMYQSWLHEHGYERTGKFEEFANTLDGGGISQEQFFQNLADSSGQEAAHVKEYFSERGAIDYAMIDLVAAIHASYPTALLSNASGEFLRPMLHKFNLHELFNEIVISSEVGFIKPSREIFEHVLDKLGVKPSEAIFIDDNPANVASASALGIHAIHYTGDISKLRLQLQQYGISVT